MGFPDTLIYYVLEDFSHMELHFFFCAGVSLGSRESPSQLEEELIMRIDWFMKIRVGDE